MAKPLRIGFIGAGGMGVPHFSRTSDHPKAEIVAVTEPAAASMNHLYEHHPEAEALPCYTDYRDMLKAEDLDAAIVLTPHTLHYEQINTCLNKGLHVLTEKPLVCSVKHAKALIKKAQAKERVLMISYQRHFEPPFIYMRDQIMKGRLGEIEFVQAVLSQEWLRLCAGTWRHEMALSGGGQLNDSGSHMVDILLWMTGLKVREVYAVSDNHGTEVDINSALTLTFDNGAMGNLSIIGNAPTWHEDHTIVGSKGALYLRQGQELGQQNAHGKPIPVKLPKAKGDPNTNFIDSILGKEKPAVPAECGLRVIELTEAAWKSAATGKPVRMR